MFRDEYTNFSFNELESENFKVWITNKNDLKRNMSPNFSDKFNTPTGSQIRYHEGTTIDKQDFKLSCAAVDVTLNEWRAITEWLSPLKQGKLRFEWNDKYYYMVKISKAPSGTMFMKGRIDDIMGQLYIITFDLEFTTVHDWAALGNYAEQNSIKEIDMSVYNNEYCIPSIIMRDKYVYRADLVNQTIYPSGDIVIVSSGDVYDFAIFNNDNKSKHHIKELYFDKLILPKSITFEFGYAPLVKVWDVKQGVFQANDIVVCSDNIEAIKDINLVVENENFKLQYKASYDKDKCIVLTLETQGVVDEYEGRFILAGVLNKDSEDARYKYPETKVSFKGVPTGDLYKGDSFRIEAIVENSYQTMEWISNANLIPNENSCFVSIDIDIAAAEVQLNARLKDPMGDKEEERFKYFEWTVFNLEIQEPKIDIMISSSEIGVEDYTILSAFLRGLPDTDFQWIIESGEENIVIGDAKSTITWLQGLTPNSEATIYAQGFGGITSEKTTISIVNSTISLEPLVGTNFPNFIKEGESYSYLVRVIGEKEKGVITREVTSGIENDLIPDKESNKILTIYAPEDVGESNYIDIKSTVVRTFTDDRDPNVFKDSHTLRAIRGIEIVNVPSSQYIELVSEGVYDQLETDVLENCLNYNYFDSSKENYEVEWKTSDETIMDVIPQSSNSSNLQLVFYKPGRVTLSCSLKENGNIIDSATIIIKVVNQKIIDWSSDEIILYGEQIGHYNIDSTINSLLEENPHYIIRAVQNSNGLYSLAYYEEVYETDNSDVLAVQISLHDFQEVSYRSSVVDIVENKISYDIVVRNVKSINDDGIISYSKQFFIPVDDWNALENKEIDLGVFNSCFNLQQEYTYEDQTIGTYKGTFRDPNNSHSTEIWFVPFYPVLYCAINVWDYNPSEVEFEPLDYQHLIKLINAPNETFSLDPWLGLNTSFIRLTGSPDEVYVNNTTVNFRGKISFGTNYYINTGGNNILGGDSYSYEIEVDAVTGLLNFNANIGQSTNLTGNTLYFQERPRHAIDSIYTPLVDEADLIPTTFSLRRSSMSLRSAPTISANSYVTNLPDGCVPQLGIVDFNNVFVGYVYNLNSLTYYRHYFNTDDTEAGLAYWDEVIGSPSYYEFSSHPSYSLLNHNFESEENKSFDSNLRLLIKSNTNTAICNTGVFNMYPLFFIKGGCVISDQLYNYYSFLTNTNMKNLFVTINSRTSTMLHNGYAIDASYNSLGMPLFKNIKNENQLVISSGKPELLKVIFESDEVIKYDDNQTDRRIATFKMNSKPVYGLRDKFVLHIFNEVFHNQVSNTYNKDNYNSLSYYNTFANAQHILLDTPEVTYYQEPGGWKMTVSYKAVQKYPDFVRHPGSELRSDDEYSNVVSVGEIIEKNATNKILYISICDYKELEVRSEGEDYSIGCQSRGVI